MGEHGPILFSSIYFYLFLIFTKHITKTKYEWKKKHFREGEEALEATIGFIVGPLKVMTQPQCQVALIIQYYCHSPKVYSLIILQVSPC